MKSERPGLFGERGEIGKFGILIVLVVAIFLVTIAANAIGVKREMSSISDAFKSVIKESNIYDSDKIIRERLVTTMKNKLIKANPSEVKIVRRNNVLKLKLSYQAELNIPYLPVTPTFTYVIEEDTETAAASE